MTLDQATAFVIILCTVGLFVWGRLPYDLVALMALLAGVLTGLVPVRHAFDGFSDEVVVIIAAALLVSAAVARSGAIETLMRPILRKLTTEQRQVPVLAGAVALLSVFSKNVGALAIFMPVAVQLARRTGTRVSALLMPMSFASLLGGLVTLIGTSPNIIVSQVRMDMFHKPFGMFAYAPVGGTIAVIGVAFLAVGYRLVPKDRRPAAGMEAAFTLEDYTTEALLGADSPMKDRTVADLERLGEGAVTVTAIVRERFRRFAPTPDRALAEGDVLILEGEAEDLERFVARARLKLAGEKGEEIARATEDSLVVEGVVTADSDFLGRTPGELRLRERFELALVAVSRSGEPIRRRLDAVRFRQGDVVVLKGPGATMAERLGELHVLPLAERRMALGASKRGWLPLGVLAVAMVAIATHLVPVQIAFFAAAVVLLLARLLTMHEAYATIEWSLLVLIAALIPVSHAVRATGGTDLVAGLLLHLVQAVPPSIALGAVLVIAMVVTPFLHNAPTVLMLGPIAATLALKLHLNPDAFLMAVALGAGCDFLTPIGHQCNTLVLGPGGYQFGDYRRLGLPLSILVAIAGTFLISVVWGT